MLNLGKTAAAIRSFEAIAGAFPRSVLVPDAPFRIGEIIYRQEKYDQAIPRYNQVLEEHLKVGLAGGVAYVGQGAHGDARGFLYLLFSVSWYHADPLELFIRFESSAAEGTLGDLVGAGPYSASPPPILHDISETDVPAGMGLGLGRSLRVRLITRYQRSENYLGFIDTLRVGM
jgi:hypothetical protein